MLKTHCDLYLDFDHDFAQARASLATHFMIFEHRKFAISKTPSWGSTGLHKIATGRTSPPSCPGRGSSTAQEGWSSRVAVCSPRDVLRGHHGDGRHEAAVAMAANTPTSSWVSSAFARRSGRQSGGGLADDPGRALGGGGDDMGQQRQHPQSRHRSAEAAIIVKEDHKAVIPVRRRSIARRAGRGVSCDPGRGEPIRRGKRARARADGIDVPTLARPSSAAQAESANARF